MADPAESTAAQRANTGLYIRSPAGLAIRDKKVERLVRRMFDVLPHLTAADRPTCKAWAQLEYLADQVYGELQRNGIFNRERESRRLLNDFRQLRIAQLPYANTLGLTPLSRMQIKASATNAALDTISAAEARLARLDEKTPQRGPNASETLVSKEEAEADDGQ